MEGHMGSTVNLKLIHRVQSHQMVSGEIPIWLDMSMKRFEYVSHSRFNDICLTGGNKDGQ